MKHSKDLLFLIQTIPKQMKSLLILLLIISPVFLYGQDVESTLSKKEQKALAKEKRKAEQEAVAEKQKEITALMLEYHRFVLEADYVAGKSGSRTPVNSTLNFVIVDSTKATLQLGSPWGLGINGVGGVTVDGNVTRYELNKKENKKGVSYNLTLYIMSSIGTYDIQMWVSQSGRADATVRGNVSGQLTYSGNLVPLAQSRVYKGTSIP
jgi:hypothetical protein